MNEQVPLPFNNNNLIENNQQEQENRNKLYFLSRSGICISCFEILINLYFWFISSFSNSDTYDTKEEHEAKQKYFDVIEAVILPFLFLTIIIIIIRFSNCPECNQKITLIINIILIVIKLSIFIFYVINLFKMFDNSYFILFLASIIEIAFYAIFIKYGVTKCKLANYI